MKKRIVIIVGVMIALLASACSTNNSIENEIIDITNDSFVPAGSGATLISQKKEDIQVIPDEYNTGCDEKNLKVVDGQGIYNEILFKLVDYNTKLALDFGYSNKDVEGTVYFENYDFSKYPIVCRSEQKVNRKIEVGFKNCKFSFFSSGIGDSNLSYSFENCTFNQFAGSNASLVDCKFGKTYKDGLIPYSNVKVESCYFRDFNYFLDEGCIHSDGTQVYGDASAKITDIFFDSCRFEIPVIKMEGNNASINACLNFQTEYNDADNVHFTNTIINGGGYSIYAWSKTGLDIQNVSFENISVGGAKLFGTLYPTVADTVTFTNVYDTPMLYASSCWKDESGLVHVIVTNDTCVERKLRIYYAENQYKDVVIPACFGGRSLRYAENQPKYSDFPFDIDVTVPEADKFVVLYDVTEEEPSEMNQIRFENFTDSNIYLDLSDEIVEDIEEEIIEELVEESIDEGSESEVGIVVVDADEEIPEEPAKEAVTETSYYVVSSGQCGNYITYSLDANGTLTLSGMGATYDYHSEKLPPWNDSKDMVLKVVVEEGISVLGQFLFADMPNLREVILPSTLTIIGKCEFIRDRNLTDIELPNSLSFIGGYAFSGNNSLRNAYVRQFTWEGMIVEKANDPLISAIVYIDNEPDPTPERRIALSGDCGKAMNFVLYEDGELVISGSGNMDDFHSAKVAPWYEMRSSITRLTFEGSINKIGEQAFRNCILIDTADIPEGISAIGKNAFIGCTSLQNVTIPGSVASIGNYAFAGTALVNSVYNGSAEQWSTIQIGTMNTLLEQTISFR